MVAESPWDEMTKGADSSQELTRADKVSSMSDEVMEELALVHSGKYDSDRAKRTAALALQCQMEMAEFLADAERQAKGLKSVVKSIEAESYFDSKSSSDKKISEAALQQMVAKDTKVLLAESKAIDAEKEFKKWAYIFGIMKEAHIFFRNLGNGKNDWSI